MDFQSALQHAAAGHLPVHMWLFYEFLVHHGELEGNSRLDKDLFFYCEVLKFKEASHTHADEELLKRKVQSMTDCYVEPATAASGAPQVDMSAEVQQKTLKAAQRYVAGKETGCLLFDDAQSTAFKELLPYWVAFIRNYAPPRGNRPIPMTRQMRERRRKLQEILRWKPSSAKSLNLPRLTSAAADCSTTTSFSFTISDGLRWKDAEGAVAAGSERPSTRGARRLSDVTDAVEMVAMATAAVSGSSVSKKRSVVASPAINDVSPGHAVVSAQA